jgi:hypothetical protein
VRKKINDALRLIKLWKPRTFEGFAMTGMRLTFIGCGAFRQVFQIAALPLVVKFPKTDDDDLKTCIRHSVIEVRKIKALREFSILRPHLPKIYYFDKASGVIVMEYIDDTKIKSDFADTDAARAYGVDRLVARLIKAHTGITVEDFSADNVRYDRKTRFIKLIDLAY